ncbi:hypothetical protein VCHA37P200_40511 [Vibrio chagasii]|nr:hypothetical protein VCHA34P131_100099 [Vibrio chagasii]CAH6804338.1 hypothetical protein VCHA29O39_110088 [Vibrio chagasii]CAH6804726.1 hypothetical protein VCHA36P166_110091 [Vibrio chagasii]CAH6835113.1 hypothetical protein VCHA31O73_10137 [Vibrio chagasii]CAH6900664.1 hypothetical protein VCHA36O157_30002 [Vibrio chagasii]
MNALGLGGNCNKSQHAIRDYIDQLELNAEMIQISYLILLIK